MLLTVIPTKETPVWKPVAMIGAAFFVTALISAVNHFYGEGWRFIDTLSSAAFFAISVLAVAHSALSIGQIRIPTRLPAPQIKIALENRERYLHKKHQEFLKKQREQQTPSRPPPPSKPPARAVSGLQRGLDNMGLGSSVPPALPIDEAATELANRIENPEAEADAPYIPAPPVDHGPVKGLPPRMVNIDSPEFKELVQAAVRNAETDRLEENDRKWKE